MNDPNTPDLSDEMLMAFADGALDEPQFSQVAEALERDETLALRLEQLVQGASLARTGFEHLLEPVSPRLMDAVAKAANRTKRKPLWTHLGARWLYPAGGLAAAALLVAIIPAIPLGPGTPTLSPLAELSGTELAGALDTVLSGEEQVLSTGTTIHAVASFEDASGALCREFETAGRERYLAVACRTEPGWSIRLALSQPAATDTYRPASGLDTLDAYLTAIGAGPVLLDEEERAALAR